MIYLDNAATTYPKPPSVTAAMVRCVKEYGGNPGRGSHRLAMLAAEAVYSCREAAAGFFGVPDPSRVVFTLNTTCALNTAIKSVVRAGDHILIGNMEHNSVRRPVERLAREGIITYDIFDVRGSAAQVMARIQKLLRPSTKAIVCAHASNICNITAPIRAIGGFCRSYGICFIVDAAQSAGILDIDLRKTPVDILCVPGHKGLYGPQGCGMMLFGSDRFMDGVTLVEGGSGVHSRDSAMPTELPEHFEAGTLPTPAIAGLTEGIRWVSSIGTDAIHRHECALWKQMYADLHAMRDVKIYDDTPGAILLFHVKDRSPAEMAGELNRAGICVRAGLHCTPMGHSALETGLDGAIRISFSAMNTEKEAKHFADVLHKIILQKA